MAVAGTTAVGPLIRYAAGIEARGMGKGKGKGNGKAMAEGGGVSADLSD